MPIIRCPHCKTGSNFNLKARTHGPGQMAHTDMEWSAIGDCLLCNREVYFHLKGIREEVVFSYPPLNEIATIEGAPKEVSRAFEEALKALGAGAFNGALCMFRRALDDALTDLQAPEGNLPTRLQHLVDSYKITPDMKTWADHARIGGKLAAHGTGGKEWGDKALEWGTQDEASAVKDFLTAFFEYVYTLPERNRLLRQPKS